MALQAPPDIRRVRRHWPAVALFTASAVGYFTIGAVLMLRYNIFEPDAPNRVANAGFALQSRHPHLSAIGFVWNPLPSMVEIPMVWLSQWWPLLKHAGLAGIAQSALFMAGSVTMVRRIADDFAVTAPWRWLAVGGFALNPMIVIYGSSGLSEAAQMFCVLWSVRYLMRWATTQWVGDLAWAGIALGVGYLARYEVVPAAAGAVALVAFVTWRRAPSPDRWSSTAINIMIVAFPIVTAFLAWGFTGWIINDEFFATLTSQYGNSSQVAGRLAGGVGDAGTSWSVIAARLLGMQPLLGVAVAAALVFSALHRRLEPVVPVVVFGATLVFAALAQHASLTFGWFRFYLLAIPLVICVALACHAQGRRWISRALVTAGVVVSIPVTTPLILDQDIAYGQLEAGFGSLVDPARHPPAEDPARRRLVSERQLALWFDRQHLPEGSVLMDTFLTWGVWLSSEHPEQFVITSDYDFVAAMNRPWERGVRYIVATNPEHNVPDAINRRHPMLWADGAELAVPVFAIDGSTPEEMFRVYRVVQPKAPPPR